MATLPVISGRAAVKTFEKLGLSSPPKGTPHILYHPDGYFTDARVKSRTVRFALICQRVLIRGYLSELDDGLQQRDFPFLETRPKKRRNMFGDKSLDRGSAVKNVAAIQLPSISEEVSTKLFTVADAARLNVLPPTRPLMRLYERTRSQIPMRH